MRLGILIGLALASGLALGFVGGFSYARRGFRSARVGARYAFVSDSERRARDPVQWTRDSTAMTARPPGRTPREIWRVQAQRNCAVGFEIRDSANGPHFLLRADARSVRGRDPSAIVAQGWTYTMGGFRPGDTATIVLPNVDCGEITIGSIGGSLIPGRPVGAP
jgi:hypothetical protein